MQGQPMQGQPMQGQPMQGQPMQGQPMQGQPMQGQPAQGQPAQGQPAQGQPAQGQPAQGQPAQGQPAQGQPAQGQPAQGQPNQGQDPDEGEGPEKPSDDLQDDNHTNDGGWFGGLKNWASNTVNKAKTAAKSALDSVVGKQLGDEIAAAAKGVGGALGEAVGDVANIVTDPLSTVKGLANAVKDPIGTAKAMADQIKNDWNSGTEGKAKVITSAVLSLFGGGAAAKITARAAKVGNIGCRVQKALTNRGPGCFVRGTLVTLASGEQVPIEQVKVGQRVQTSDQSDVIGALPSENWRKIELRLETGAGTRAKSLDVTLLRPEGWVAAVRCAAGARMWLDLEELRISGNAEVIEVGEHSAVEAGSGHLVTATLRHTSDQIVKLEFELPQGREVIQATNAHPFYSLQELGWKEAGKIEIGEAIESREGVARLVRSERASSADEVFNLEVDTAHEYLVGASQLRCHNACGPKVPNGSNRLPQDARVNPTPPDPLPTNRPIGRSATQNATAQQKVADMKAQGYTDIRVNQQQVNAAGDRVGTNRPDVQGTRPDGTREYWEYDTDQSNRGPLHEQRIRANDAAGDIHLENVN
ncbi:polymorphic toxin-type HINT domain-containing protein [Verrucomicrobium sp. BvORR034]|uniref:polymorphic toxin-type HINT domain-containing protein n=1 Tax=Verrucomicrobium sp. BvORR034 TaxID=1396418 RepID=UPI002240FE07|nr:polymorphic toxin-type HINT domain-containing protein [Verrucomicrobium sp. BvORR034]